MPVQKNVVSNVPSVCESTAGSPIQLKRTARIWDEGPVQGQGFCCSCRAREIDEAVTSITTVNQYALVEVRRLAGVSKLP